MASLFNRARSRTRGTKDKERENPTMDRPPQTPSKEGSRWRGGGGGVGLGIGVGGARVVEGREGVDEMGRLGVGDGRRLRVISEPGQRPHQTRNPKLEPPIPTLPPRISLRPTTNPTSATDRLRDSSGSTSSASSGIVAAGVTLVAAPSGGGPVETRQQPIDRYSFLPTRFPSSTGDDAKLPLQTETFRIAESGPSSSDLARRAVSSSGDKQFGRTGSWVGVKKEAERIYGYIGVQTGLVLGLEEISSVVEDVGKQLSERGLETAMLFSTKALDLSAVKVKFLIDSYIKSLSTNNPTSRARATYTQNLRFAHPHELAWFLRWALARVVRITRLEATVPGPHREFIEVVDMEERGLLEWEGYENWRGRERANHHDRRYFEAFVTDLTPLLKTIVATLFTILSRLSAHSHTSGCSPTSLSTHFGPLLFGCGHRSCSFDTAHTAYVRSAGATEHLLLAFIRFQAATQDRLQGEIPRTLRNWIKGYPSMIMSDRVMDQGLPRKGVKVVKVERATRVVRAYSKDLLRTGQTWTHEIKRNGGSEWVAWNRVVLRTDQPDAGLETPQRTLDPRLPKTTDASPISDLPQLTDNHCKRLNLEVLIIPTSGFINVASLFSTTSSSSSGGGLTGSSSRESSVTDWTGMPRTPVANNDKYGSLTDQAWGAFEGLGFDSGKSMSRILDFDLTESAKERVKSKRNTMSWNEFAAPTGGFDRSDDALSKSLTFSPPVQTQIESWPEEREELRKKLKKSQKEMAKFDWDTTPVVGVPGRGKAITVIEEAFIDVWADLLLSSGWTDYDELTYREANWALVEYKALPNDLRAARPFSSSQDPRTASLLFCFEEFVPQSYQTTLQTPRAGKLGIFGRHKTPKKTSATSVPSGGNPSTQLRARTRDEAEFDALLRRPTTKMLTLSESIHHSAVPSPVPSPSKARPRSPTKRAFQAVTAVPNPQRPIELPQTGGKSPSTSIFRNRTLLGRKVKSHPNLADVDGDGIETRTIRSSSGPSSPEDGGAPRRLNPPKQAGDMWIDILVAGGARRMESQDARLPSQKVLSGAMEPMPTSTDWPMQKQGDRSLPSKSSLDTITPITTDDIHPRMAARPLPSMEKVVERDGPSQKLAQEGYHDHSHDPSIHSHSALEMLGSPLGESPVQDQDVGRGPNRDTVVSVIDGYGNHGISRGASIEDERPMVGSALSRGLEHRPTEDNFYTPMEGEREDPMDDGQSWNPPAPQSRLQSEYDEEEQLIASRRTSDIPSADEFPPPVTVADIEAIARQPSPGRYHHGAPLDFVGEEPEEEEERGERANVRVRKAVSRRTLRRM